MSEPDVFETRFAAAYRRYIAEAPTEVDAVVVAHAVVSTRPRMRRRLGPAWSEAWSHVPAIGWALLVAGLLLGAVIGGTLGGTLLRTASPSASPTATPTAATPTLAVSRPTTTLTSLGTFDWQVVNPDSTPGFMPAGIAMTSHGLVTADLLEGTVRWSFDDGRTWQEAKTSVRVIAVAKWGDDILALGAGAVRLSWDGVKWAEVEALVIDGREGRTLEQAARGPGGYVLVGRLGVYYSTDGHRFSPAERAPDPSVSVADPGPCIRRATWPGEGRLGPLLATAEGFWVLAPGEPANWNSAPTCEPIIWFSPDGRVWSLTADEQAGPLTSPFGTSAAVDAIATKDRRFVAVGAGRPVGGVPVVDRGAVWASDSFTSWERLTSAPSGSASSEVTRVAAGDLGWMLVEASGQGWLSADGRTWEPIPSGWPGLISGWSGWPSLAVGPTSIVATGQYSDGPNDFVFATVIATLRR